MLPRPKPPRRTWHFRCSTPGYTARGEYTIPRERSQWRAEGRARAAYVADCMAYGATPRLADVEARLLAVE